MVRSRFIPVLLYQNKGFVKSFGFKDYKYLGDPTNIIKIFNEKKANEILIYDIDSKNGNHEIDFLMLEKASRESRMPICYGGGVSSADIAEKLVSLGIEKVSLGAAALNNAELLKDIAHRIGKQSVVHTLDVRKKWNGKYEIYSSSGSVSTRIELISYLKSLNYDFIGEVVINSVDRDGTRKGYDTDLIQKTKDYIKCHVTYSGGCSSISNALDIMGSYGPLGLGVSSEVVFQGKYNAVLISYPSQELKKLYQD